MSEKQASLTDKECPNCHRFTAEKRKGVGHYSVDTWNPRRGHSTEPTDHFEAMFLDCEDCGLVRIFESDSISRETYEELSDELPTIPGVPTW